MSRDAGREKRLAKKRERKRLKRKALSAPLRFPSPQPVGQATGLPRKFMFATTPQALETVGPLVRAQWTVPRALADQLVAEGLPVPGPITGHMLVDTGASATAIAQHAAEMLGLQPIGTCRTYGAHGAQESARYRARFALHIANPQGGALSIFKETDVTGIPGLQESFARFGVQDEHGNAVNVVGVIGRDFLRLARMVYDGAAGTVEIEMNIDSLNAVHGATQGGSRPS